MKSLYSITLGFINSSSPIYFGLIDYSQVIIKVYFQVGGQGKSNGTLYNLKPKDFVVNESIGFWSEHRSQVLNYFVRLLAAAEECHITLYTFVFTITQLLLAVSKLYPTQSDLVRNLTSTHLRLFSRGLSFSFTSKQTLMQ